MEYYDKLKENDFSDSKLSKFSKEIAKIAMNIKDNNTHNNSFRIKPNQTHKGVNRLDMSLLKAGVYNFTINYEGRTSTKKVIKK